jgi:mRNA-degrading endonuclease RelE of RelBE toxin-antitoxin system
LILERLRFAPSVGSAWERLDDDSRAAARAAFEKIDDDPIAGVPLLDPLRGYWSMREGSLRIVYRIFAEARYIVILSLRRVEEGSR